MDKPISHASTGQARFASTLTLRIRRRLLLGVLLSSLVALSAVVAGVWAFLEFGQVRSEMMAQASVVQDHLTKLNDAIVAEVLHTHAYLITGNDQSIASRDAAHQDTEREYAELKTRLNRLPGELLPELQRLMTAQSNSDALGAELIAMRRSGQVEAAVQHFDQSSPPLVSQLLGAQSDLQRDVRAALNEASDDYETHTGQIVVIAGLIFLAAIAVSSWLVTRLLASPLQSLDYIEQALIETAQAEAIHPVRLPASVAQAGSLFQAYNSLVARLEESEVSRLSFVSSMTHALQTQLASILGYASLLADPAWQSSGGGSAQYAQIIVRQSRQMGRLLEDMVTVALIDEDRLDVSLAPLRLGPLVAVVVEETRQQSGREVQIEDHLGPELIMGDALRLREVLSRLLDNALKFSAPDTLVRVNLQLAATPGWIEIALIDHGIEIAESDLPLLFRRFGRIRNKETQDIAGSGLGLYISRYIVERHHGQITVRSEPGQQTDFVVTLPLVARGTSLEAPGDSVNGAGRRKPAQSY